MKISVTPMNILAILQKKLSVDFKKFSNLSLNKYCASPSTNIVIKTMSNVSIF